MFFTRFHEKKGYFFMFLVPPKPTPRPTPRWTDLFYHEQQQRYFHSQKRFNIAHAGRRGGKTDIAKRKLINRAYLFPLDDGRFVMGTPSLNLACCKSRGFFLNPLFSFIFLRKSRSLFKPVIYRDGKRILCVVSIFCSRAYSFLTFFVGWPL